MGFELHLLHRHPYLHDYGQPLGKTTCLIVRQTATRSAMRKWIFCLAIQFNISNP